MSADYTVKAGAVPGPLQTALSYSDGTVPDLTPAGTTVAFRMRPYTRDPAVVHRAGAIVGAATVQFAWQAGDLAVVPGLYEAEFQVTWASGATETFPADPNHPYILILVEPVIS